MMELCVAGFVLVLVLASVVGIVINHVAGEEVI